MAAKGPRAPAIRATKEQNKILKASFEQSPTLLPDKLKSLSEQTGLQEKWISQWYMRQRGKTRKGLSGLGSEAASTPQTDRNSSLPPMDISVKLESRASPSLRGSSPGASVVSTTSVTSSSKRPRKRAKKDHPSGGSGNATKAIKLEALETTFSLQVPPPEPLKDSQAANRSYSTNGDNPAPTLARLLPLIAPAVRSQATQGPTTTTDNDFRPPILPPSQPTRTARGKTDAPGKSRGRGRGSSGRTITRNIHSTGPTFQITQFQNAGPTNYGGTPAGPLETGPADNSASGRTFTFVPPTRGPPPAPLNASTFPNSEMHEVEEVYASVVQDEALAYPQDNMYMASNRPSWMTYGSLPPLQGWNRPYHDAVLDPSLAPLKHLTHLLETFRDEHGHYTLLLDIQHRQRLMMCLLDDELGTQHPFEATMGLVLLERLGLVCL